MFYKLIQQYFTKCRRPHWPLRPKHRFSWTFSWMSQWCHTAVKRNVRDLFDFFTDQKKILIHILNNFITIISVLNFPHFTVLDSQLLKWLKTCSAAPHDFFLWSESQYDLSWYLGPIMGQAHEYTFYTYLTTMPIPFLFLIYYHED